MKPKIDTIIRTVTLFIVLLNQILICFDKNPLPFAENDIYNFISTVATVIISIITWWKNNDFTQKALANSTTIIEIEKESEE